MFMWRSAPWFSSFTGLVSQPVRGTASGPLQRSRSGKRRWEFRGRRPACSKGAARPGGVGSFRCVGGWRPARLGWLRIRSSPVSPTTTETGLRETVLALAGELAGGAGAHQAITLERPPRADFGDYSTNAALLLAPAAGIAAARAGPAAGGCVGGAARRAAASASRWRARAF